MIEPADKFLTTLKDEEWKNVRAIISTVFSSGKMKLVNAYLIYFKILIYFLKEIPILRFLQLF